MCAGIFFSDKGLGAGLPQIGAPSLPMVRLLEALP
jgi:hypothetical protein